MIGGRKRHPGHPRICLEIREAECKPPPTPPRPSLDDWFRLGYHGGNVASSVIQMDELLTQRCCRRARKLGSYGLVLSENASEPFTSGIQDNNVKDQAA